MFFHPGHSHLVFSEGQKVCCMEDCTYDLICWNTGKCTPNGESSAPYDGQESTMLHTKFRGNRPSDSGEEYF